MHKPTVYKPSLWRAPGACAALAVHGLKLGLLKLAQRLLFGAPRADAARVAIYRIGSIGDMAVAAPALAAIRKRHPQAELTLITNAGPDWPAALGLDTQFRLRVRAYADVAALREIMRQGKFDALYYLAPAPVTARRLLRDALFFCRGVRRAAGFTALDPCARTARLLRGWLAWPGQTRRLMAACRLGKPAPQPPPPRAPLPPGVELSRPLAVIAPAGKSPVQHWPEARFLEIAARLIARGYAVAWLGDDADGARIRAAGLQPNQGLDLCGKLSVAQAAAVLCRADLVVGNDSGLVHLAASNQAPVIVVQSSRSPLGAWAPYKPVGPLAVLRTDMNCEGCALRECSDTRCIMEISVEQAWQAVENLLAPRRAQRQPVKKPEPAAA